MPYKWIFCLVIYYRVASAAQRGFGPEMLDSPLPAAKEEWSFFAKVYCGIPRHECFGAVIHPKWVLTSAYCINLGPCKQIELGSYFYQKPGLQIEGDIQVGHPDYKRSQDEGPFVPVLSVNDIGLVKMKEALTQEDQVKVIKLAKFSPSAKSHCKTVDFAMSEGDSILAETNQIFTSCETVENLYEPYKTTLKTTNLCRKIGVTHTKVVMGPSRTGGPIKCDGELNGIFSATLFKNGEIATSWMLTAGYGDWVAEILNDNLDSLTQFSFRDSRSSRTGDRITVTYTIFIVSFCFYFLWAEK